MNDVAARDTTAAPASAPALKEIFNADRIRHIAAEAAAVFAGFDSERFVDLCLDGIDGLSLMARLRRVTEALHATLPVDYRTALDILRRLAPRLDSAFVTMVLPDYVALYGQDDFDTSMAALKYFTVFGSSEFAVRHFLRREPARSLAFMESWTRDDTDHVRRLASEGSRPRLPWSFKLDAVIADPSLTWAIVDALKSDPSRYVRKSVANHLNDIAKDHPGLVAEWLETHLPGAPAPRRALLRHASRTLIKAGDLRVLGVWGLGQPFAGSVEFTLGPQRAAVGGSLELGLTLRSSSRQPQPLVIDYAVHHVKANGSTSPKVFKGWALTLAPGEDRQLARRHSLRPITTRRYFKGHHRVELLVNGTVLAEAGTGVTPPAPTARRLLLLEDDPAIAHTVVFALQREGFEVCHATLVREAARELAVPLHGFAAALLDIGLPDGSGLDLCRELRRQDPHLPVMMLSARGEEIDRVL
eukprot:gene35534-47774_t